MIKTKFVFAVSMVAMLSCGVAWASAPSGSETVATEHKVYEVAANAGATNAATDLATGIAGVTYVNRMVNMAGNAAQLAEDHAAAAGTYAIEAEKAAQDAEGALSGKLDNKFNLDAEKNAIVTTDKDGNAKPVAISDAGLGTYITDVEVENGVVTLSRGTPSISSNDVTSALDYTPENVANKVKIDDIVDCFGENPPESCNAIVFSDDKYYSAYSTFQLLAEATLDMEVTTNKVTGVNNAVTLTNEQWESDNLYPSMNTATKMIDYKIATNNDDITGAISDVSNAKVSIAQESANQAMITDAQGNVTTGQIKEGMIEDAAVTTTKIKDAAVTVAKTSGIFGYIPTKSDGTGSAHIWVE